MFMVLLLHANIFCFGWPEGESLTSLFRLFMEGVTIISINEFLLITGYFGTSFKISKVFNIVFQILYTVFIVTLALIAFGLYGFNTWKELIHGFYFWNYWFLNSYIVLIILSPLLNLTVKHLNKSSFKALLIMLFIVFCLIDGDFFVSPPGIGVNSGYSALWFAFVYLVGRYLAKYPSIISTYKLVIVYVIGLSGTLLLMNKCRDYGYNSPFIFIQSIAFFLLFLKMRFTSKLVNFIASSSLMVFLFHCHPIVIDYYKGIIRGLNALYGNGIEFLFLLSGFCGLVYLVAIIFDQGRKFIWHKIETQIRGLDQYLIIGEK